MENVPDGQDEGKRASGKREAIHSPHSALRNRPLPSPSDAVAAYEAAHFYRGFPIADLRAAFARVCDADDWEAPWQAAVPRGEVAKLRAAADYFHADEPIVAADHGATVELRGSGRQRWE